jgi:hypothetical protein
VARYSEARKLFWIHSPAYHLTLRLIILGLESILWETLTTWSSAQNAGTNPGTSPVAFVVSWAHDEVHPDAACPAETDERCPRDQRFPSSVDQHQQNFGG